MGNDAEVNQPVAADRQDSDAETVTLERLGAFEHAFMLGREYHHAVLAELAVEARRALDRHVVGLGRPRGENEFTRIRANQISELRACLFDRLRGLAAIGMRERVRIAELLR